MNKLIIIVGPSGVGKTSLLQRLASRRPFALGLEQHAQRPFQALFDKDRSYALPNQLDYLLVRAEQERQLRLAEFPGLMDGGLDMDFHVFTRLFQTRGYLSDPEFALCEQFYRFARELLPEPDLVVAMHAPPQVICDRLAGRDRINIASPADTELLAGYLNEWLETLPPAKILRLDVSSEPPDYLNCLERILHRIENDPA